MSGAAPTFSRRAGGFTLIELLVVAAIIIIILAISFPAYNKLTSNNSKSQAVNAISSQAAAARSLALSMQRQVALVFYEDPTNRYQTRMVLVAAVANVNGGTEFGAIPDRPPVSLPKFIKVATLDVTTPAGAFAAEWGADSAAKCRAFVFDEKGRPVIRTGLLAHDADGTTPRSAKTYWGLSDGSTPGAYGSAMSLVVYDITEFNDANPSPIDDATKRAAAATWLINYSDILSVHPYTGAVVR